MQGVVDTLTVRQMSVWILVMLDQSSTLLPRP